MTNGKFISILHACLGLITSVSAGVTLILGYERMREEYMFDSKFAFGIRRTVYAMVGIIVSVVVPWFIRTLCLI